MDFLALREKLVWVSVRKAVLAIAAMLGVFLVFCLPLFSQGNQGTIQGSAFDQSGGVIAGATVTIVDASRGISRTFTTDSAGAYVAANLTPGTYLIRVEAKGFQTLERSNVSVEVGQNIRVDLTLSPGAQTQTITVTEEAPAVDTTDATLGGTLANQAINALPLNGRNYERLLQLRPGIITSIGQGSGSESSNGLRAGENITLIEGLATFTALAGGDVMNTSYHQGDATSLLPIDAIQEFNVEQVPKAEYGWKFGSIQNVGVKSGTNSIHGTAYAFGRDDAWDSANYFTGGVVPMSLEQYGVTAGGPIIKDKLFWFLGFENLNYNVGDSAAPSIPSDFTSQLSATQDPGNKLTWFDACTAVGRANVNPLSALLAGLPTGSCAPQPATSTFENAWPFVATPPSGQAITFAPNLISQNPIPNGVAKLDYNLNSANHLSFMYFKNYSNTLTQGSAAQLEPRFLNKTFSDVYDANGSWVWTPNSTWVNEFRAGIALSLLSTGPSDQENINPAVPWPTGYGMNTGVTNPLYAGLPRISISGFSGQLGEGSPRGIRGPSGTADYVDHVSYLRGKHQFKFGGEFLDEYGDNNPFSQSIGVIQFSNLQNYMLGIVQKGSIALGNAASITREHSFGGFFQDDWRVTSKLTLNLGLRYEYNAPPTERNNFIGNFYPNVNPATASALGQAGGPFPPLYNPDYKDFGPRFGLAWDVRGDGKTVVRAGANIMYTQEPIGVVVDINPFGANVPSIGYNTSGTTINNHSPDRINLTTSQFNWSLAGPVFPTVASLTTAGAFAATYTGVSCTYAGEAGLPAGYTPTPCSLVAANDPNFRTPRAYEWDLDIQRAITNNLTVEAAYVGNHSREASQEDINQPPIGSGWNNPSATLGGISPTAYCLASAPLYNHCSSNAAVTAAVTANEVAGQVYENQFPYLANINQNGSLNYSNYDALQATVTERASHGLYFISGFTWSHALSNVTSSGGGPADIRNLSIQYGNDSTDSRLRFTISPTYNIPGLKSPGQLLEGWSVSGIWVMYSAQPWSVSDGTEDLIGTGEVNNSAPGYQPWNYSGPTSAFTAGPHDVPCFGSMSGCTPYSQIGGAPPAACISAAQNAYAGSPQLQQLAVAALTNLGCYVRGAGVLTPPAYGTVGNASPGMFRGQPFYNVDLSVAKTWKFKERFGAQFRADFFNLFNRADFANPTGNPGGGGQFGCTCLTPDETGYTDSVLGSGSPRAIQIGLKLSF